MRQIKKILFSASIVYSIGILLGRISGYLREIVIASTHHISATSDKIILLLTIPDFINNLLSVTTVGAIILPLIVQFENEVEAVIYYSVRRILLLTSIFLVILIVVLGSIYELDTFLLITISLLSVIPNAITAVFVPYLNHKDKFLVPSLGTLIFNGVIILFLLFSKQLYVLACGVIVASIFRLGSIVLNSKFEGLQLRKIKRVKTEASFSYKMLLLSIVSNGILFINPLIDKVFASRFSGGSLSILSYSEKIYLLPVSVYLTSMAVTSFPTFVRLYTTHKINEFIRKFKEILGITSALGFITALIFVIFNDLIVQVFYGIAGLNESNMREISKVTMGYVPMLVMSGANAIVINSLYAIKNFKAVLYLSILLVLMKLAFNFIILINRMDIVYIPYSTSMIGMIQLVVGLVMLYLSLKGEKEKWSS